MCATRSTESQDLAPCPFCGGEPAVERPGTARQSCIVACTNCGGRLESNEIGSGHHWNRRAADALDATPTDPAPARETCKCHVSMGEHQVGCPLYGGEHE